MLGQTNTAKKPASGLGGNTTALAFRFGDRCSVPGTPAPTQSSPPLDSPSTAAGPTRALCAPSGRRHTHALLSLRANLPTPSAAPCFGSPGAYSPAAPLRSTHSNIVRPHQPLPPVTNPASIMGNTVLTVPGAARQKATRQFELAVGSSPPRTFQSRTMVLVTIGIASSTVHYCDTSAVQYEVRRLPLSFSVCVSCCFSVFVVVIS